MKRLFLSVCLTVLCANSWAGKETNDIMFELSFAKRFMQITDTQQEAWDKMIVSTQEFPDKIQGTRAYFKSVLSDILDNESLSYVDIQQTMLAKYYLGERYNNVMEAHHAMTNGWASLDAVCTDDQRKEFRNKMHSRIMSTFKNTSDKLIKNIRIENLDSDDWAQKLELSQDQRSKIRELYVAENENLNSMAVQITQYQANVNAMLTDVTIPMQVLPASLKNIFLLQRDTVSRLAVYYQNVYTVLNDKQRKYLTDSHRTKLKYIKYTIRS